MPPVPIQKMRSLSPSEIEDLAEAITPHFELLIRFSAQTGLRIGEIAGLQGGDYHSGRQTVSVKRQLLKDTVPPVYGDPKTRAGVRTLTLTPALAERIESLSVIGSAPMFTSPEGQLLNVANFRRRHFLPAVATAGLGSVQIHDLRHTAIFWWIQAGATIKHVTEWAGIASVTTAFDRYGHLYPSEDRDLADRLDDV